MPVVTGAAAEAAVVANEDGSGRDELGEAWPAELGALAAMEPDGALARGWPARGRRTSSACLLAGRRTCMKAAFAFALHLPPPPPPPPPPPDRANGRPADRTTGRPSHSHTRARPPVKFMISHRPPSSATTICNRLA